MKKAYTNRQKILFRMPNWLGDAVMALPAVQSVKKHIPDAIVGLAIKENIADLGKILPAVDLIHPLPDPGTERRGALRRIRHEGYDMLICFPNSFRSAWEFWGAGIPVRVGYSRFLGGLFLNKTPARPAKHSMRQADYFFRLAQSVFPDLSQAEPVIKIDKKAMEDSIKLLPERNRPLVGIGFGASYGSAKMWPAERFAQLAGRLSSRADVVLLGASSDKDVEDMVMDMADPKPAPLAGKTDIPVLAATLSRLAVYVTNDTGPMHLAAAVGTPVVALFGPTDPNETSPDSKDASILYHKADCAPCWKRKCPTDHRCMNGVSVDEVERVVLEKLFPQGRS